MESSKELARLRAVLEVVNAWEATGKAFFSRDSNQAMSIWVRDPRLWGGDPNVEHWQNAREIETALNKLRVLNFGIKIDRQSGCLLIQVPNIYPKGGL